MLARVLTVGLCSNPVTIARVCRGFRRGRGAAAAAAASLVRGRLCPAQEKLCYNGWRRIASCRRRSAPGRLLSIAFVPVALSPSHCHAHKLCRALSRDWLQSEGPQLVVASSGSDSEGDACSQTASANPSAATSTPAQASSPPKVSQCRTFHDVHAYTLFKFVALCFFSASE